MKKAERDYKLDFSNLSAHGFARALKIARCGAMSHTGFQHYTTLKVLQSMLKNRTMWLSRLDAPSLNDGNESGKYGSPGMCKRTYVGCFSYGRAESAAMWGMYCAPNSKAIRILITPRGMNAWKKYLADTSRVEASPIYGSDSKDCKWMARAKVGCAGITDVLYAAVKNRVEDPERANDLYWNFTNARIEDLQEWIKDKDVGGFLKDYEWRYEQETRLYVRLSSMHRGITKLSIRIPDKVFGAMSIVLSPWLDKECAKCYIDRISEMFRVEGFPVPRIRASYLTGTINLKR